MDKKNRYGDQLSARLTQEQHDVINANCEAWTGQPAPTQKEFFAALLKRAAENNGENAESLGILNIKLSALNTANELLTAENERLIAETTENKNSILVEFEPADLFFIGKMMEPARKKYTTTLITPAIYIRALIRGLYESGHIWAAVTFSDALIKSVRKTQNTPPDNG